MGEDAGEAVDQFIGDIEARFEKMQLANYAAVAVERDSHAIKSAAGLLGLKRLATVAAEVEELCRHDRDAVVIQDVTHMRAAFDAARVILSRAA
jgi:HPt (histidine-containing phosphotransfer) domain-containing protein